MNTIFAAIAAVGPTQQPRLGHNPVLALFFIVFIMCIFGGGHVAWCADWQTPFKNMEQQAWQCAAVSRLVSSSIYVCTVLDCCRRLLCPAVVCLCDD